MPSEPKPTRDDPRGRAFGFLQHLATDLSNNEVTFPTFVDAAMRVRSALNDPNIDLDRLARIISGEPLLSAKLVRIANSAAMKRSGKNITDVKTATAKLGFNIVRATAVAIALDQVRNAKEMKAFESLAAAIWRHSLTVAANAYVLARRFTRISPDEALFVGLVHDIGRFYLLARAASYPELADHPAELDAVLNDWHAEIGTALLQNFALPEHVIDAVRRHETGTYEIPPRDLTELIVLANRIAHRDDLPERPLAGPALDTPELVDALAGSAEEIDSLAAALGR